MGTDHLPPVCLQFIFRVIKSLGLISVVCLWGLISFFFDEFSYSRYSWENALLMNRINTKFSTTVNLLICLTIFN